MERERGEEIHITPTGHTPERGVAGGAAPAAAAWPATGLERLSWGAVWSGLLVALATQMILSAFGLGLNLYGLTESATGGIAPNLSALGLWTAIWALISLFLGGLVAARLANSLTAMNGIWHGIVVWALTLALGTLLTALGITGVFGFLSPRMMAAPGFGMGDIMNTAWGFFIGSLLGLGAAVLGGWLGRRSDVTHGRVAAS
ncbi:MAG: hypothetical protein HY321_04230 [Armatimonadetes bacterium]|nr:hypothetical protein [Armatimonadota bacterium]